MEGVHDSSSPDLSAPTLNLVSQQTVSDEQISKRTLILADGTCLVFAEADVPNLPTTTFADNIPHLNRMWDDTSNYWNGESVLMIHGHPIPIVRWPDVYKRWRRGDWDTIKSNYVDWKVWLSLRVCVPFLTFPPRLWSNAFVAALLRNSGMIFQTTKAGIFLSRRLQLA
jgi:hypothetical protein